MWICPDHLDPKLAVAEAKFYGIDPKPPVCDESIAQILENRKEKRVRDATNHAEIQAAIAQILNTLVKRAEEGLAVHCTVAPSSEEAYLKWVYHANMMYEPELLGHLEEPEWNRAYDALVQLEMHEDSVAALAKIADELQIYLKEEHDLSVVVLGGHIEMINNSFWGFLPTLCDDRKRPFREVAALQVTWNGPKDALASQPSRKRRRNDS